MSTIVYDFWGKYNDRSVVLHEFDGLDAKIFVEDQNGVTDQIEVAFSRVVVFDFQSICVLSYYPTEVAEKLVEKDAPSDIAARIQPEWALIFEDGLRMYEVYFEDYGMFTVIATSVAITKRPGRPRELTRL